MEGNAINRCRTWAIIFCIQEVYRDISDNNGQRNLKPWEDKNGNSYLTLNPPKRACSMDTDPGLKSPHIT
jgi:hypothetical protein